MKLTDALKLEEAVHRAKEEFNRAVGEAIFNGMVVKVEVLQKSGMTMAYPWLDVSATIEPVKLRTE